MNSLISRKLVTSLLAVAGGWMGLSDNFATAQNVIRGAVPGWPGNTAYYAPQNVYQYAPAQATLVVQSQYSPQYSQQPAYTYYAPAAQARIAYAVPATGSYQVSYAGAAQPGLATTAYYGGYNAPVQRVMYMPQQQVYYRPVTVYQPGAAVAQQSCGYAATCQTQSCQTQSCQTSSCQTSSCGSGWSPWRPFAWLWRGNNNTCCKPQQTCYTGCGQQQAAPYYTVPVIPTAPAPGGFVPASPFRSTIISPGTVPSPGTRAPGGTIINSEPANSPPRLDRGSFGTPTTPLPGSGFNSGIPVNPNPGIGPPPGSFAPPTTDYRPTYSDPYSQPIPVNPNSPIMMTPPSSSTAPVYGSGYRSDSSSNWNDRTNLTPPANRPNTINEPSLSSPPSSVQPLRDPHGDERNQPSNRAPQLLGPSDRTAAMDNRWAVIPAVWPVRETAVQPIVQRTEALMPVVTPAQVDDGGWKSAR